MSKTSEKSLKGKHPTFVCHDLSVWKRKRNECKKEEEINWQIAWYDGLDVLLLNTQKIHSFCVFVRLKIQAQNTNLKHKMFSLLKPNPIFMFYMHDHFTFIKTKNIRGFLLFKQINHSFVQKKHFWNWICNMKKCSLALFWMNSIFYKF